MPRARENEEDQVLIDSSFGSDRLKRWRNFPGPIKERSKLFLLFTSLKNRNTKYNKLEQFQNLENLFIDTFS